MRRKVQRESLPGRYVTLKNETKTLIQDWQEIFIEAVGFDVIEQQKDYFYEVSSSKRNIEESENERQSDN